MSTKDVVRTQITRTLSIRLHISFLCVAVNKLKVFIVVKLARHLNAFKDHYNLSEDDLNQEISDSHLDQIALKHCACWKLLSPHLDLGNMTINDITLSLTLATETDN